MHHNRASPVKITELSLNLQGIKAKVSFSYLQFILDSMNSFQLCIMLLFVALERLSWSGLSDVGRRIMILFFHKFLISIVRVKSTIISHLSKDKNSFQISGPNLNDGNCLQKIINLFFNKHAVFLIYLELNLSI